MIPQNYRIMIFQAKVGQQLAFLGHYRHFWQKIAENFPLWWDIQCENSQFFHFLMKNVKFWKNFQLIGLRFLAQTRRKNSCDASAEKFLLQFSYYE